MPEDRQSLNTTGEPMPRFEYEVQLPSGVQLEDIVEDVECFRTPWVLTRGGKDIAVIVSFEDFTEMRYALDHPEEQQQAVVEFFPTSCSDDCINGVDRGEHADLSVWHHRECPNHTISCCDTTPDLCHIYFFDKGRHDFSDEEPLWSGPYQEMSELFDTLSAGDYILLDDDGKIL